MLDRPYRRTCRQFADGSYSNGGVSVYIEHEAYAHEPDMYVRAFLLIQKDLQNLFEYIEPDDQNTETYSFRTHEMLVRTCIEIEASFKAILNENKYFKKGNLNMKDYCKIERSHRLSGYEILVPHWRGPNRVRKPFSPWSAGGALQWYQAYNNVKHNRQTAFKQATFNQVVDATCGLMALLSAQFHTNDFGRGGYALLLDSGYQGFENCIGSYFMMKPPEWPLQERYGFTYEQWTEIVKSESDPFRNFQYPLT